MSTSASTLFPTPTAIRTLSVIVPTLNEAERIRDLLTFVLEQDPLEILIVDGGSEDGTARIAREMGVRVEETTASRGVQLSRGASLARGDAVFFLHADTMPPRDFPRTIRSVLSEPGVVAGAFRLRLDASGMRMRGLERLVDLRTRLLRLPFGDQGIFVRRDALQAIGGVPELPVMEDYELIRRLRRIGRIASVDASAVSSARRWVSRGFLKATLLNQLSLLAYTCGISADRISGWRG